MWLPNTGRNNKKKLKKTTIAKDAQSNNSKTLRRRNRKRTPIDTKDNTGEDTNRRALNPFTNPTPIPVPAS